MAENKKSFVLYADTIHTVSKMSDEQAGKLFKIILDYVNDNDPQIDDLLLDLTFEPIKQQLKRDLVKYRERAERSRANGQKGGRPKSENNNPEEPKETQQVLEEPKETHSVILKPRKPDSVSDSVSDSDIYNNMLENEFQAIWKKYTLDFMKKLGRSGGSKSKALAKYKKLRAKHSNTLLDKLVQSELNKTHGSRDLERVFTPDNVQQILEDGIVEPTKFKGVSNLTAQIKLDNDGFTTFSDGTRIKGSFV